MAASAAPARINGRAVIKVFESGDLKISKSARIGHRIARYSKGANRDASACRKATVMAMCAKPPKRPARTRRAN